MHENVFDGNKVHVKNDFSEFQLNDSFHGSLSRALTNFRVTLLVNNSLTGCVRPASS